MEGNVAWHAPEAIIAGVKLAGVVVALLVPIGAGFGWMIHRIVGRLINQFEATLDARFEKTNNSIKGIAERFDRIEDKHTETRRRTELLENEVSKIKGEYVTREEFNYSFRSLDNKMDNLQSSILSSYISKKSFPPDEGSQDDGSGD